MRGRGGLKGGHEGTPLAAGVKEREGEKEAGGRPCLVTVCQLCIGASPTSTTSNPKLASSRMLDASRMLHARASDVSMGSSPSRLSIWQARANGRPKARYACEVQCAHLLVRVEGRPAAVEGEVRMREREREIEREAGRGRTAWHALGRGASIGSTRGALHGREMDDEDGEGPLMRASLPADRKTQPPPQCAVQRRPLQLRRPQ